MSKLQKAEALLLIVMCFVAIYCLAENILTCTPKGILVADTPKIITVREVMCQDAIGGYQLNHITYEREDGNLETINLLPGERVGKFTSSSRYADAGITNIDYIMYYLRYYYFMVILLCIVRLYKVVSARNIGEGRFIYWKETY